MGVYIKKKIVKQMEIMDSRKEKLPRNWDKFLHDVSLQHNILLKYGKECYCTQCGLKFKTNKRVDMYEKCPFCKQNLLIRNHNLKKFGYIKDLNLLDKVDDQLIIRVFELSSTYQPRIKKFTHSAIEYGRIIVGENVSLLNDRIKFYMASYRVFHIKEPGKWRKFTGYYGLNSRASLYPYNIKYILKGTRYEYSMLWDFVKKVPKCDIENLLTGIAKYPSFELLVKMKLYNLALKAEDFNIKGNFKERFGVDKEYYDFMKKNNITVEQLKILENIKTPDIKLIKCLLKEFSYWDLTKLSKYINVKYLMEYKAGKADTQMYLDYLEFAEQLGMNMKDKKVLFPENLKELHDKYYKRISVIKNKKVQENVIKRSKELLKNKFQDDKYIVYPAASVNALKDESKQQNHCVQSYAERYANATCDIYFMRLIDNIKKSLVTIEVRDNKIVQKRIKGNDPPTEEQNLFLEKWQQNVLQSCKV